MRILATLLLLILAGPTWPGEIPRTAFLLRHKAIQIYRQTLGAEAQPSKLMAQLHVESHFKENAKSWAGARGICQFMPATARGFEAKYPGVLIKWIRYSPEWCLRAQALYIREALGRDLSTDPCTQYALAFMEYNGGWKYLRWQVRAAGDGASWETIADGCRQAGRSARACDENTKYPGKVFRAEPGFVAAGFPGGPLCVGDA